MLGTQRRGVPEGPFFAFIPLTSENPTLSTPTDLHLRVRISGRKKKKNTEQSTIAQYSRVSLIVCFHEFPKGEKGKEIPERSSPT
jgi:hypothetical protein